MNQKQFISTFLIWLVAMLSTLGSLFFSEIMEFVPCSLCWYQRIFMYPIAIITMISIYFSDHSHFRYTWSLAIGGLFFALYHNLLHWGVIAESMSPCRSGIPCSTVYIEWLGFITIPFLSLIAFVIINSVLFYQWRLKRAH